MRLPLEQGLAALGVTPPAGAVDKLLYYADLLIAQNQVMNLTAITDPLGVCELHFLDSAALLALTELRGKTLIDIGTGAGFPGVVLKILEPSLELTLLDSLGKRIDWLKALCRELGLEGVTCIHGRAEALGRDPALRDCFDCATARAVASLPQLSELCLPFVKPGGLFLAMKAEQAEAELLESQAAIDALGGGNASLHHYQLPLTKTGRKAVMIAKSTPTPPAFPRKWAKIKRGGL